MPEDPLVGHAVSGFATSCMDDRLTSWFAFVIVPLVCTFFIDLANAVPIRAFLASA